MYFTFPNPLDQLHNPIVAYRIETRRSLGRVRPPVASESEWFGGKHLHLHLIKPGRPSFNIVLVEKKTHRDRKTKV